MIMRDHRGRHQFSTVKAIASDSAKGAEFCAIEWTAELATLKGWQQVEWSSDALNVVKEINSPQDPTGWDTTYTSLMIRNKFSFFPN